MEPLTPALEDQAQAAIAEVGATKVTGSCAGTKGASEALAAATGGTETSKGSTAGASTGGSGALAAGTFGSKGFGGTGGSGSQASATTNSSNGKGQPKRHVVAVNLAGFNRVEQPGWLLPALGVLVLVLLLPGLAFLMSGRSLRPEVEGDVGSADSSGSTEPGDDGDVGTGGDE